MSWHRKPDKMASFLQSAGMDGAPAPYRALGPKLHQAWSLRGSEDIRWWARQVGVS